MIPSTALPVPRAGKHPGAYDGEAHFWPDVDGVRGRVLAMGLGNLGDQVGGFVRVGHGGVLLVPH